MKIRIRGNSVRFRLTQSEVKQLCESGTCTETTTFPNGIFTYAVALSDETELLQATLCPHSIRLEVCRKLAAGWEQEDRVGFEHRQDLGNENQLHLLLEKDFVCLDERDEDESDNYPNPKALTPTP